MSKSPSDIKTQRDRFLAFAFASADLLIEISDAGDIRFAAGATKTMSGKNEQEILKTNIKDLIDQSDHPLVETILKNAANGNKQGPYLIKLTQRNSDHTLQQAFLTALSMPHDKSIYLSMSLGSKLLKIMGFDNDKHDERLPQMANKENFEDVVRKTINAAKTEGKDIDISFLEMAQMDQLKSNIDAEQWQDFIGTVSDILLVNSAGGEAAAEVEEGKFAVLHDPNVSMDSIEKQIQDLATETNNGEEVDIGLASKSIQGDIAELSDKEASRALMYTMQQFESKGMELSAANMKDAFQEYLSENAVKIKKLKQTIAQQQFTLNFQPIVELETMKASHYEVLMRFEEGKSPFETLVFGEEVGLAPEIDIAVCRQTFKFLDKGILNDGEKVAINVSGQSVQSEDFISNLMSTLDEFDRHSDKVMFEITESTEIHDLNKANDFIQTLRKRGFKICLDDFGAGAASFQYLHQLEVDIVKIDGMYIRTILEKPRDATLIKNLTQMCHELDIKVVAEMVETEDQANYLRNIGVDKGQGWLFGKPEAKPNYQNPE